MRGRLIPNHVPLNVVDHVARVHVVVIPLMDDVDDLPPLEEDFGDDIPELVPVGLVARRRNFDGDGFDLIQRILEEMLPRRGHGEIFCNSDITDVQQTRQD